MNQTTKQMLIKISIVLSVLYLIYLVLDYNDCLRCIKMHVYTPSMLIDNYKYIDKTLSRTVVNIFSNVSDIKNIYPTLNSILDQTQRIDMIYVTIDTDGSEIDTGDIKKLEEIAVLIKSGSKNSIENLILREGDINTLIININKHKIYHRTFIEECVNKTRNFKKDDDNKLDTSENNMIYKNTRINL